jgi:hypothetical protein
MGNYFQRCAWEDWMEQETPLQERLGVEKFPSLSHLHHIQNTFALDPSMIL